MFPSKLKGSTFLIPSGPASDPDRMHLHVCVSDEVTVDDQRPLAHVIVVSVSSVIDGVYSDPACELDVGDHPFIRRRSYVVYAKALATDVSALRRLVEEDEVKIRDAVREDVLKRIISGLLLSRHTPNRIKGIVRYAQPGPKQ
jgi:hypothetical protein